MYIALEI